MLIAAIDPVAEVKLDGLDHALSAPGKLPRRETPVTGVVSRGTQITHVPVLAAASSGIGEYSVTAVQRLAQPCRACRP